MMKQSLPKSLILMAIIFMDLLAGMEFDLFVPSFPQLQHHFNLSPFWVEALLSVNYTGYCIGLFVVGGLADRYGRKPIILCGLITFVIGSVLCVWAASYEFLLAGRFLQGIGVAAPAILSFLIIADTYPLKEQQFLMAMLNAARNVAVAISPVIGSYITLYFHWRGNFAVLLLLGLITLGATVYFIPQYKLALHKETISPQGYRSIFQSKPLMLLIVTLFFISVPYWIFVGMSPLLYIKDLGVSLSHFGYYQGILALVFAMGSLAFGLMMKNSDYDLKKMLSVTIFIYFISIIMISWVTFINSPDPMLITVVFLIFIIGQIIPNTLLYPVCINFAPAVKGRVSAIMGGGSLVFTSFGLQLAGYFYRGSFQNIGIILVSVIFAATISLFFVVRNQGYSSKQHAIGSISE